jgi:hypothetical protein
MTSLTGDNGHSGLIPPSVGEIYGVWGDSNTGMGVAGTSSNLMGVYGESVNDDGVVGLAQQSQTGVLGFTFDKGAGVEGSSDGFGVHGESRNGTAGYFEITSANNANAALEATTAGTASGVYANSLEGAGAYGYSVSGTGIYGTSGSGHGTFGYAQAWGIGAIGYSEKGTGVYGVSGNPDGYAGYFVGNVLVTGTLTKGAVAFKIDHPLDPANKYLSHSSVESPDMKNIYDGIAVLDADGEAEVELPPWFEALNTNFRYQLTCIGEYAQIYIAEKIHNNHFKIAGGRPGMEICWQVTGIRQDPYAIAHRIQVEEEKSSEERGHYLHPELFGEPEENHIDRVYHSAIVQQAKQSEEWRVKQQAKQSEEWRVKQREKLERLRNKRNEK